ncbi:MAG: CHRD domain-containing protein, partial [Glaciecola sp.]
LEQSMDDMNVWMTPADLSIDTDTFEVLASGGHYVNIHTPANPSGELRGQIITDDYVLVTFSLDGDQQVPANASTAKGDGYALINSTSLALELTTLTTGVADATAAHIHIGATGTNGPVLVGLLQDAADVNAWFTPATTTIDTDTLAILLDGGHYVNVHTPAFPGGEIRGQIQ